MTLVVFFSTLLGALFRMRTGALPPAILSETERQSGIEGRWNARAADNSTAGEAVVPRRFAGGAGGRGRL